MKKLLMILLLSLLSIKYCEAQTFAEWFRQKETQKKYLLQQIAAFQIYLGYLQEGYSIAQKGLNTVRDIKRGEFNLHKDYFNSLKTVNPKIKNEVKVADIISLQLKIVQAYKGAYGGVKKSNAFNEEEMSYINRVFQKLLDHCAGTVEELITVTTSNELRLKDDERLKRIDALYNDMQEAYLFAQSFGKEAMILAAARIQEKKEIQRLRSIYGIK